MVYKNFILVANNQPKCKHIQKYADYEGWVTSKVFFKIDMALKLKMQKRFNFFENERRDFFYVLMKYYNTFKYGKQYPLNDQMTSIIGQEIASKLDRSSISYSLVQSANTLLVCCCSTLSKFQYQWSYVLLQEIAFNTRNFPALSLNCNNRTVTTEVKFNESCSLFY